MNNKEALALAEAERDQYKTWFDRQKDRTIELHRENGKLREENDRYNQSLMEIYKLTLMNVSVPEEIRHQIQRSIIITAGIDPNIRLEGNG